MAIVFFKPINSQVYVILDRPCNAQRQPGGVGRSHILGNVMTSWRTSKGGQPGWRESKDDVIQGSNEGMEAV